jgi:hypothetical protein
VFSLKILIQKDLANAVWQVIRMVVPDSPLPSWLNIPNVPLD